MQKVEGSSPFSRFLPCASHDVPAGGCEPVGSLRRGTAGRDAAPIRVGMITAEQLPVEAPPALAKHRYPLPIVLAVVITLVAAAYSFARAPALIDAGHEMRAGQAALARGDYDTAVRQLRAADAKASTSHDITISLAEAEFADSDPAAAMRLLRGVKLDRSEWTALQRYMPAQYQRYFVHTS
jgi:hypothetical protein